MTTDEAYVLFSLMNFEVEKLWSVFPKGEIRMDFVHLAAKLLQAERNRKGSSTPPFGTWTDRVIATAYAETWNEWKGIEP